MITESQFDYLKSRGRHIENAQQGDEALGPLQLLPGVWKNEPGLPGRGWNMIALPFATPGSRLNYRLLMNQYNETLTFSLVDKAVPNRGIRQDGPDVKDADQLVVTLDYEQQITQIAASDFPESGKAGPADLPIHHEPGLFLHMLNETTEGLDIARLGTIPHGNSLLALGRSEVVDGPADILPANGLPIGGPTDLDHPYLAPYKHFADAPFQGLFDPTQPAALLAAANQDVTIKRTTVLDFDTKIEKAGVVNIPFIERQADTSSMKSTFWIQELEDTHEDGSPKLRLQYLQVAMLDFFPRFDGAAGLIEWPHISINTMEFARPAQSPIA